MLLKMKRFFAYGAGVSLVFLISVSLSRGAVETKIFNEVAEYVLRNTTVGASIVNRISGLSVLQVTEESYSSFVARLKWKRNLPLRTEIQSEFAKIEAQLEKFRTDQNRPAKLEEGKPLPADDLKFLDEAAASLRTQNLETLVKSAEVNFVEARFGPPTAGSGNYNVNGEAFTRGAVAVGADIGAIPPRVDVEAVTFDPMAGSDLRELQLNWWKKMIVRFNARRRFVKAMIVGEGDWRNIFIRSGKPFTLDDLATIRKYNRLLDGLNDYAQLRLMVRAFANEPAAVYTRLTELTVDATAEYAKGFMSIDTYVGAIKAAAATAKLPLNDIVFETQKRILTVIERCNTLGGKLNGAELGQGEVVRAERGVVEAEEQLHKIEAQLLADAEAKDSHALIQHRADRDLARQRLDLAARILGDKSFEFVRNRDLIETFVNLRGGKINWETVQRFDMADPFYVDQSRIDAWAPIYERSLARSINRQFKHEVSLAIKAQIGGTRKAVRSLNKLTEQVTGRLFTDTTTGKGLQTYAKHQFAAHLIRLGKLLGITVPVAIAEEVSGHQMEKFLKSLLTGDDGEGSSPTTPRSTVPAVPFTPTSTPFRPTPTAPAGSGMGSGSGSSSGLPPITTPSAKPSMGGAIDTPPFARPRIIPNPIITSAR